MTDPLEAKLKEMFSSRNPWILIEVKEVESVGHIRIELILNEIYQIQKGF